MKKKKIAVIGLGDFGMHLVVRLFEQGHEVIAIDKITERILEIKDHCTNAVETDATDNDALKRVGIADMDFIILATADNFETLMVTSYNLKEFGPEKIFIRYKTEIQKRILASFGIINFFNPEEKAARNMAEQFMHTKIRDNLSVAENFRIAEIAVPELFINKTVEEVHLKEHHNLLLITIKRIRIDPNKNRKTDRQDDAVLGIPAKSTYFKRNDVMVVFGKNEDISIFLENM